MFAQLLTHCRFGSALRTLALALLLSGAASPTVFADHMGNHARQPTDQSASQCGAASGTVQGPAVEQGVSGASEPRLADPAPGDTTPAQPSSNRR